MRHIITNTVLTLTLALLAYLPFSVYKFEDVKNDISNEQVLSATTDILGRYISFGPKESVVGFETAFFKVFNNKSVTYTDFYSYTNTTTQTQEIDVKVVGSDYIGNFELYFTDTNDNYLIVYPGETVGLSARFGSFEQLEKAKVSFILTSKSF